MASHVRRNGTDEAGALGWLLSEFAYDPKLRALPKDAQQCLMMLASFQCRGDLDRLDDEDLASVGDTSTEEFAQIKATLLRKGLINRQGRIVDWRKRPSITGSSTPRVRAFRLRKREAAAKQGADDTATKRTEVTPVTPEVTLVTPEVTPDVTLVTPEVTPDVTLVTPLDPDPDLLQDPRDLRDIYFKYHEDQDLSIHSHTDPAPRCNAREETPPVTAVTPEVTADVTPVTPSYRGVTRAALVASKAEKMRARDAQTLAAARAPMTSHTASSAESLPEAATESYAATVSRVTEPLPEQLFEEMKAVYPPSDRPENWKAAWNQWRLQMTGGIEPKLMLEGAKRYRAYCDAKGNTGERFVMDAKKFFGPERHFELAWAEANNPRGRRAAPPPDPEASAKRQQAQLAAAQARAEAELAELLRAQAAQRAKGENARGRAPARNGHNGQGFRPLKTLLAEMASRGAKEGTDVRTDTG